ncbi:hypothetical protein, partial [Escherichia coli]|uniref:hypothetical protein n=1 Tax=Escherichia coli TaxID=562 RepID=UPI0018AD4617
IIKRHDAKRKVVGMVNQRKGRVVKKGIVGERGEKRGRRERFKQGGGLFFGDVYKGQDLGERIIEPFLYNAA